MLLPDEWPWLETAARNGNVLHGTTGLERCLLYDTAIQTGLRASELLSLTRGSLELNDERPHIVVKASHTKNKTTARQYISLELAEALRRHVERKTTAAPVFSPPSRYVLSSLLREDLAKARKLWLSEMKSDPERYAARERSDFLQEINEAGEKLDFHALRHTCGSWFILAGENINVVQQVMRHSTVTLTVGCYGHMRPGATADAVLRLRSIQAPRVMANTGTDPCSAFVARTVRKEGSSVRSGASGQPDQGDPEEADESATSTENKAINAAASTTCGSGRGGDRTRTRVTPHGILSPVRLPIPPLGLSPLLRLGGRRQLRCASARAFRRESQQRILSIHPPPMSRRGPQQSH